MGKPVSGDIITTRDGAYRVTDVPEADNLFRAIPAGGSEDDAEWLYNSDITWNFTAEKRTEK